MHRRSTCPSVPSAEHVNVQKLCSWKASPRQRALHAPCRALTNQAEMCPRTCERGYRAPAPKDSIGQEGKDRPSRMTKLGAPTGRSIGWFRQEPGALGARPSPQCQSDCRWSLPTRPCDAHSRKLAKRGPYRRRHRHPKVWLHLYSPCLPQQPQANQLLLSSRVSTGTTSRNASLPRHDRYRALDKVL